MNPQPVFYPPTRQWVFGRHGVIVGDENGNTQIQAPMLAGMSPYGKVGDRLWVRENFRPAEEAGKFYYMAEDWKTGLVLRGDWKPSIHMPRTACRIVLEIIELRVERVKSITEEDAQSEAVDYIPKAPAALNHRTAFAGLWDSMNAKRGYLWEANPWVWAITFKRV